jgi:hypothetical protein
MTTITIPQHIALKGDLIIIPRTDYEALVRNSLQTQTDWIYEKPVSKYLHTRIKTAESEFKKGKATRWQIKKK